MKLVDKKITKEELKKMSSRTFGKLVKAVVDIKKGIMMVDSGMHADEEKFLLDMGSKQDDLWGINLYPGITGDDFIEYDSMINIRPRINNFTKGVDNPEIRKKIIKIVNKLINK